MTTKADLLAGLRVRLNDLEARRWQDSELNVYLNDATRDYSKYFPRQREQQFIATGVDQRYAVPDDLIDDQVLKVTIIDPITKKAEDIPNIMLRRRGSDRYWEVVGEELVLGWMPYINLTMVLRYNAIHDLPDNGVTTIPYEDEDLVYAYAMAAAWQRIGGNDAGLSRWTEDKKRDDSPIIPHYVHLWDRYNRLIKQKQQIPRFYQRVRTRGTWRN